MVLANKGYDVFLGNNRGNYYSRKHQFLTPENDSMLYFDYSFYKHGKFDVTAQLNKIYEITLSIQKIAYVGHSMGTSAMFAMLADDYPMKTMVDLFIACAPIVHLEHIGDTML